MKTLTPCDCTSAVRLRDGGRSAIAQTSRTGSVAPAGSPSAEAIRAGEKVDAEASAAPLPTPSSLLGGSAAGAGGAPGAYSQARAATRGGG